MKKEVLVQVAKELININIELMSRAEKNICRVLVQEGLIEKVRENTDEYIYILKN